MSKKTSVTAPKLMTSAAVEKEINAVAAAVGGIGKRIHEVAIQCLLHATTLEMGGYGDARLMDKLVKALTIGADGRGRRKAIVHVEGIVAWCTEFSPIRWNGDGAVKMLSKDSKDYNWDVAQAIRTPFWEVAGQVPVTAFTLASMLKVVFGMKSRLTKAIENERFEGDAKQAAEVADFLEKSAAKLAKQYNVDLNARGGNAATNPGNPRTADEKPAPATRRKVGTGAAGRRAEGIAQAA